MKLCSCLEFDLGGAFRGGEAQGLRIFGFESWQRAPRAPFYVLSLLLRVYSDNHKSQIETINMLSHIEAYTLTILC